MSRNKILGVNLSLADPLKIRCPNSLHSLSDMYLATLCACSGNAAALPCLLSLHESGENNFRRKKRNPKRRFAAPSNLLGVF